jgi:hypothetical protein
MTTAFTREDVLDRTPAFLNARCPICGGLEGCSHTILERARAALAKARGETELGGPA